VTVYGATRNLHSGHYGNWAPDTPALLVRILALMKDDEGRVVIDGWYDTADPIGAEERAALRNLPDHDAALKRELGIVSTEGQPATLPERLLLPALTIRGLTSGNTGTLAANVIPNTAVASLGIRLVKGNDPARMRDLLLRHIRNQGYHVVGEVPDLETRLTHPRIAKVTVGGGTPAARTSMRDPFAQQVIRAATEADNRAFGDGALIAGLPATRIVYMESPGPNTFEISDVPAVVEVLRAKGVATVVDNICTTPLFFKPIEYGVDIYIHSVSKYISGHSDTLLGTITTNKKRFAELDAFYESTEHFTVFDSCYSGLKGVRSLSLRMSQHQAAALEIAKWLEEHPAVETVIYPALESHPEHHTWRRDMPYRVGGSRLHLEERTFRY
jgi:hypothetical protein